MPCAADGVTICVDDLQGHHFIRFESGPHDLCCVTWRVVVQSRLDDCRQHQPSFQRFESRP